MGKGQRGGDGAGRVQTSPVTHEYSESLVEFSPKTVKILTFFTLINDYKKKLIIYNKINLEKFRKRRAKVRINKNSAREEKREFVVKIV